MYAAWRDTLAQRLARTQNADGSWTGLHCITDPTYNTAAAVLALSAERDEPQLIEMSLRAVKPPAKKDGTEQK